MTKKQTCSCLETKFNTSQLDATEKNISVLQLNIADLKKIYKKYMLAGILLHILKLKTTYSHKNCCYGGCNQSLVRKQIIFTAFWSKVLDFFYNWYIDSVCEDKALHQVWRQNVN